jgi:hypothetical protein
MGMPALPGAGPINEFGANTASPVPPPAPGPVQSDTGALSVLNDVNSILSSARNIGDQYPATQPIVQQIQELVHQLQMKIVQALPPTPVMAPPV